MKIVVLITGCILVYMGNVSIGMNELLTGYLSCFIGGALIGVSFTKGW